MRPYLAIFSKVNTVKFSKYTKWPEIAVKTIFNMKYEKIRFETKMPVIYSNSSFQRIYCGVNELRMRIPLDNNHENSHHILPTFQKWVYENFNDPEMWYYSST